MNRNEFIIQLSKIIRKHRKLGNLSQNQLADFAGVGKTVIFDLEHAKPTVKLDTLLKVLEVLNINLKIISPVGEENASSKDL